MLDEATLMAAIENSEDRLKAGWHILLKLREATSRPVKAYQMKWRPAPVPRPLTPFDRKLLEKLLSASLLADVREEIRIIAVCGDRGDFEQETLTMERWL